ncbi:ABC-type multidrug transport system, ATPase component [Propionispira arboris]|uniref:ABC-type multidrug transport system, ATPase component n=1 Tax=Propionispira arboris TaxID=84035 RepID=A0A1H7CWS0_9FIRM|nr:ATP-binding cassette domain-containing protein [Propionispira arboris]SEJ93634.1 ABC-type multidrug transport system, ATPase component [Propionispira arboris]
MLEIEAITKYFAKELVLDRVSTCLPRGLHVLTGPNGAGKTTLLRILAGILPMTSGHIELNGIGQAEDSQFRTHIGYVPQSFGVYPEMTPDKFLLYFADLKGFSRSAARIRVAEVMELVRIQSFRKEKLGIWTKGMRQKIGIAQALLNDPALLLMDEPLSGLDTEDRSYFYELFSYLAKKRIVILSSHIVTELDPFVDRIMLLYERKLQFDGIASEMIQLVSGKVWSASVTEAEWNRKKNNFPVSRFKFHNGMYEVRLLCESRPDLKRVFSVQAGLEDAYINFIAKHGDFGK